MADPDERQVRFTNPEVKHVETRDDLGDIRDAARAAEVKPDTIRMWVRRRKVEPIMPAGEHGPELYHLPTIEAASKVKRGRPRKTAAA